MYAHSNPVTMHGYPHTFMVGVVQVHLHSIYIGSQFKLLTPQCSKYSK